MKRNVNSGEILAAPRGLRRGSRLPRSGLRLARAPSTTPNTLCFACRRSTDPRIVVDYRVEINGLARSWEEKRTARG